MKEPPLIQCFQDTLEKSNSITLKQKTAMAVKSNKVYKEGFISHIPKRNEYAAITVCAGTTFETAKKYHEYGKVAVLNFANPENPGGGVTLGAMAQEECLCRSSNLYSCISNQNVFDEYYAYHRNGKSHFYSDRLIYSKNITVFKSDDAIPQSIPQEEWFDVDVITCAAPYLGKRKYTNGTALLSLFKGRIKNIFEVARNNGVDAIILGAFGCGAFKNPPMIVAEAFRQVICEENYFGDFKQIVFAIKPTGKPCPNLDAFVSRLYEYAPDAEKRCCILSVPIEWRFKRIPRLPVEWKLKNSQEFTSWQLDNKYFGKQFSVLGDSISTLEGYNPSGYKIFYGGDNSAKSGVSQMEDTWWDKVIGFFGGELLVNNSWSGSRVTKVHGTQQLFPSGCSNERTSSLHINDIQPDVILIYLGTNDWAFGAKTGNETRLLHEDELEFFDLAYGSMLKKLKMNYPQSEIWCFTLSETFISKRPDFQFPHKYAGTHMDEYNDIIRNVAWKNECKLIDLYRFHMPYDSLDGSHPTNSGMDTIATMVIRAATDENTGNFLDCADNEHEENWFDLDWDNTYYIRCKKCGKKTRSLSWEDLEYIPDENKNLVNHPQYENVKSEYVLLDSNITEVLYSNILHLTSTSTGTVFQIQKNIVNVGREKECDFFFEDKPMISRYHATFFYEHEKWFLCDNSSKNGTWINGIRIEPGKKYQLAVNDEINFAMTESVIFEQSGNLKLSVENSNGRVCGKEWKHSETDKVAFVNTEKKHEDVQQKISKADKYIGKVMDGRYSVLKQISRGGSSKIYLVQDIRTNKMWTMKACDKTNRNFGPVVREIILKEVHILAKMEHPAIPRVLNIFEDEECIFIIREYIEGEDLKSVINRLGPQPIEQVVEWGKELCDMLEYLHCMKPPHIYRDMKTANVMLTWNQRMKVIDFGIMRIYDSTKDKDTCSLGTRGYAAPEQYGGWHQSDARTDIFGLGMTLHYLVTGIDPTEAQYITRPICEINPSLSKGLEYIICKCTEPNPERRYQSCAELLKDLERYQELPPKEGLFQRIFRKKNH